MDTFAALAVPTRRNIAELLARRGQLSATDICERFDVTPSAISQHLKVLLDARLVTVERRAQQRIYELNPEAIHELADWAAQMSRRFDRMEDVMKQQQEDT
ncbi:MAG: metalloregulator ArsR/SmtB family transcription factor [Chloroflexi bacterium]|nr:metalloregulator ArsR/SmtB family transcription factor [Chloroflexota bacterium]